jgi:hypothetical protein
MTALSCDTTGDFVNIAVVDFLGTLGKTELTIV